MSNMQESILCKAGDTISMLEHLTAFLILNISGRDGILYRNDSSLKFVEVASSGHAEACSALFRCFSHVIERLRQNANVEIEFPKHWVQYCSYLAREKIPLRNNGIAVLQDDVPAGTILSSSDVAFVNSVNNIVRELGYATLTGAQATAFHRAGRYEFYTSTPGKNGCVATKKSETCSARPIAISFDTIGESTFYTFAGKTTSPGLTGLAMASPALSELVQDTTVVDNYRSMAPTYTKPSTRLIDYGDNSLSNQAITAYYLLSNASTNGELPVLKGVHSQTITPNLGAVFQSTMLKAVSGRRQDKPRGILPANAYVAGTQFLAFLCEQNIADCATVILNSRTSGGSSANWQRTDSFFECIKVFKGMFHGTATFLNVSETFVRMRPHIDANGILQMVQTQFKTINFIPGPKEDGYNEMSTYLSNGHDGNAQEMLNRFEGVAIWSRAIQEDFKECCRFAPLKNFDSCGISNTAMGTSKTVSADQFGMVTPESHVPEACMAIRPSRATARNLQEHLVTAEPWELGYSGHLTSLSYFFSLFTYPAASNAWDSNRNGIDASEYGQGATHTELAANNSDYQRRYPLVLGLPTVAEITATWEEAMLLLTTGDVTTRPVAVRHTPRNGNKDLLGFLDVASTPTVSRASGATLKNLGERPTFDLTRRDDQTTIVASANPYHMNDKNYKGQIADAVHVAGGNGFIRRFISSGAKLVRSDLGQALFNTAITGVRNFLYKA